MNNNKLIYHYDGDKNSVIRRLKNLVSFLENEGETMINYEVNVEIIPDAIEFKKEIILNSSLRYFLVYVNKENNLSYKLIGKTYDAKDERNVKEKGIPIYIMEETIFVYCTFLKKKFAIFRVPGDKLEIYEVDPITNLIKNEDQD